MGLPFRAKARVIKVESVDGIEGPVFFRPWKLGEYEKVTASRLEVQDESQGIALMKQCLAEVLTNEAGDHGVVAAGDLDQLDSDLVGRLFELAVNRCGIRSVEDNRKN